MAARRRRGRQPARPRRPAGCRHRLRQCAVGDPACDVVIAWTLLAGASRQAFRSALASDDRTWARGRGWALWKALITLVDCLEHDPPAAEQPRRVIKQALADHARQTT